MVLDPLLQTACHVDAGGWLISRGDDCSISELVLLVPILISQTTIKEKSHQWTMFDVSIY
jgi:hypothetical protein